TAGFTAFGSLEEISTFASISFILIFGVVNYVALKDRDLEIFTPVPVVGLTGAVTVLTLEIYHLVTTSIHLLLFIGGIFTVIFAVELIYFERDVIEEHVEKEEEEIKEEIEELEEELEEN
ncbi:MAG: hypothetical protein ABEJ93_02035, partial [Candidatus Nanohalobium sp.]